MDGTLALAAVIGGALRLLIQTTMPVSAAFTARSSRVALAEGVAHRVAAAWAC